MRLAATAFGATILCLTAGGAEAAARLGQRCGGYANTRCAPGLFCARPPGYDRLGTCMRLGRPGACPRIYLPVCGENGRTYPNECVMRARGVGKHRSGPC